MRKIYAVVITVCVLCPQVGANSGPGTTACNFLKVCPGVRASGMGEAYCALADEVNGMYSNPAGLARLETKEISFMHAIWLENISYEHLAFAYPKTKIGIFGLSINYLSMAAMEKIGITGTEQPELTGDTFGPSDFACTLSFAKTFSKISSGISVKIIRSKIDEESASTFALDIGGIYDIRQDLSLGLAIKNIGSKLRFITKSYPLPLEIKSGLAYRLLDNKLVICLDLNKPFDNDIYVNLGAEYRQRFGRLLSLAPRVGYKTNQKGMDGLSGLTSGLGFRWKDITVDYGWVPFGDLGNTHRISLTYFWGDKDVSTAVAK
jgi:hypothetical protein